MQELELLQNTPLFTGIPAPELEELLGWLAPVRRRYHKGEIVLMAGYPAREIGVVVEGLVQGAKPAGDGRQLVVGQFGPGGVFGDVLASGRRESPVTLTALCDSLVLFVPVQALTSPSGAVPPGHACLVRNLLRIISEKYFELDRRLDLLLLKSLRGRLCLFLMQEAATAHSNTFCIPMNRAQLAEYLGCERSALCRELSRMQKDGLIETYRGSFKLLRPAALGAALPGCTSESKEN